MVENQLEQIPTNRSVEAKDQRPFCQNLGLKLQIQLKIKINREAGEYTNRVWPPGHTLVAETRPRPRFRGFVRELGGAFAPPIFIRSYRWVFAYKYWDFQSLQGTIMQRQELVQFFTLCSIGFHFLFM